MATAPERKVVFISHANPEDNAITLWLAARLAGLGYQVWSDVTKLLGGEYFWQDIEDLLRNHTAKVLSLVSPSSPKKAGFRRELGLACTVEAKIGDPRFIIPLVLKGGEFSDLPIEIHGKIGIPFKQEWHRGLAQLLDRLEKDGVPRSVTATTAYLSEWSRKFLDLDKGIVPTAETLLSSEIPMLDPVPSVRVFQVPQGFTAMGRLPSVWPCKAVGDYVIAFAGSQEWSIDGEAIPLKLRAEVPIVDFIKRGVTSLTSQTPASRRAAVAEVFRLAWERFVVNSGLVPDQLANQKLCWFFPGMGIDARLEPYVDALDNQGKRQLGGQHKSYSWHYAIQAIPRATEPFRFSLKAHVTFSEDGRKPIEDTSLKHSMRRRIAKLWWQDKWRDLMSAYLAKLAAGSRQFSVPLSNSEFLQISARPIVYSIPVSPWVDDGVMEPDDDDEEDLPVEGAPVE